MILRLLVALPILLVAWLAILAIVLRAGARRLRAASAR